MQEEKNKITKLSGELKETRKALKKSESRCEQIVKQVEDRTIAKTTAMAETTRITTLADSLQVLLDSKKSDQNRKREEAKCKYWNKGYCCKCDECSWFHPEEDCQEHVQEGKCYNRKCSKRHIKICKYWASQSKSCRRGNSCQYLHTNVKNIHENHNQPTSNDESAKDTEKDDTNEKNNIIDMFLKGEVRKTVIEILKEMTDQNYNQEYESNEE